MAQTEEFLGTGRRKTAVARVRLSPSGSGKITINGRAVENYFTVENQRTVAVKPLETVEMNEKADVRVKVAGGGIAARPARCGLALPGHSRNTMANCGRLSRTLATSPVTRARRSERSPANPAHENVSNTVNAKLQPFSSPAG